MKKNYIYIASVLAAVFTISSCQKILDVKPGTQSNLEEAFTSVPSATSVVMGVYQLLAGDDGYGQLLSLVYINDTDEMSRSGAETDAGARGLARYAVDASNTEVPKGYIRMYNAIERANVCIKNIPLMNAYISGSESDKKEARRLYGEALALRAIYYFDLVKNYGDVPFRTEPAVTGEDFDLPRTNADIIYDFILDDLKTAERLLPWRKELISADERLTQGAVRGMRARIALFRGGYMLRRSPAIAMQRLSDYKKYYQITKDECDTVILSGQHSLNASFYDVFKKLNELTLDVAPALPGERMLEVAMAGSNANYDSKLGRANGPSIDAVSRYGQAGGATNPVPSYFYEFLLGDTRRDVTIANYKIAADNTKTPNAISSMYDGKYRRDWRVPLLPGTAQTIGINWVMLRYSDILLMYAEAVNELNEGPTAEALLAVNQIRRRAFGKSISVADLTVDIPAGLSKSQFFDKIVLERKLEFGGEGLRKYDLIRWNLLDAKLKEAKAAMTAFKSNVAFPQYLYYKKVGEEIEFYNGANAFYLPAPTPAPTGYTRLNWRQDLLSSSNTFIDKLGKYFKQNHSEVLPIGTSITALSPNLKNSDYGY